jgi:hypothetical protein
MIQQLKTLGLFEEARSLCRTILTSDAPGARSIWAETWWAMADLKTGTASADDRARMMEMLEQGGHGGDGSVYLHYAIAKALDDAGDLEGAFGHYSAGARQLRRRSRYKAEDTTRRVRATKAALGRMSFIRSAADTYSDCRPIFIVGLPRAGSTLVEQILASHPSVEATMELVELPLIARSFGLEPPEVHPERLAMMSRAELDRVARDYEARTRIYRKTDRPYFTDKMPNNWLHTGLILSSMPHAKIIDVRRGPLAVGVSAFKQLFAQGQPWSYDLSDIGHYYRDYVEMMDQVDKSVPGAVHRLIYEDLIDEPEREIRRLLAYCDLDYVPDCLDFHATIRPIWTPSAFQVRQPLYMSARDAWRPLGKHLQPLRDALGDKTDHWR